MISPVLYNFRSFSIGRSFPEPIKKIEKENENEIEIEK